MRGGLASISGITKPPANHLVSLRLENIPHSAYISPEAMVALPLCGDQPRIPQSQIPIPTISPQPSNPRSAPTHTLPALSEISFYGVSEYLEDFISRVDAPLIDYTSPPSAHF